MCDCGCGLFGKEEKMDMRKKAGGLGFPEGLLFVSQLRQFFLELIFVGLHTLFAKGGNNERFVYVCSWMMTGFAM